MSSVTSGTSALKLDSYPSKLPNLNRGLASAQAPALTPSQVLTAPRVRKHTRAVARTSMKLRLSTVALFAAAITVLLFIVYSYMELTEVSSRNKQLSNQINKLEAEEYKLRNQFESIYSMTELENYAINELGMVRPGPEQIIYIDLAGEDEAVVIDQKSFWNELRSAFTGAMAAIGDFWG